MLSARGPPRLYGNGLMLRLLLMLHGGLSQLILEQLTGQRAAWKKARALLDQLLSSPANDVPAQPPSGARHQRKSSQSGAPNGGQADGGGGAGVPIVLLLDEMDSLLTRNQQVSPACSPQGEPHLLPAARKGNPVSCLLPCKEISQSSDASGCSRGRSHEAFPGSHTPADCDSCFLNLLLVLLVLVVLLLLLVLVLLLMYWQVLYNVFEWATHPSSPLAIIGHSLSLPAAAPKDRAQGLGFRAEDPSMRP